jgi:molybdate transport system substrate-binding protein
MTKKNRLILGDSVMQTAQLVESGGAEVGMINYSLALAPRLRDQGRVWEVPIDALIRAENRAG